MNKKINNIFGLTISIGLILLVLFGIYSGALVIAGVQTESISSLVVYLVIVFVVSLPFEFIELLIKAFFILTTEELEKNGVELYIPDFLLYNTKM